MTKLVIKYLSFLSIISLSVISVYPKNKYVNEKYLRYINKEYNYCILIPSNWKKSKIDFKYKHMLVLTKGYQTEINITATKPDLEEINKWDTWKEWYINDIGIKLNEIIETKNILIEKDIIGKLFLFEYRSEQKKILQRIMISKFDDKLIIIECKAPINLYKNYIDTFNAVMGSLKKYDEYLKDKENQNIPDKKENKDIK